MENNHEFDITLDFALQTSQHIFLTGKAGSGKTTLLKHIAARAQKNYIIVAPTGVAAINAGGTTIHSMFYLPTTAFVPTDQPLDMKVFTNRKMLGSHMKYSREKRKIFNELELLIIDEVSMVRCDLLDAVDFVLRTARNCNHIPFGGVQVMLIGDMHQLPPVTREIEWGVLRNFYASPYFFDSQVWPEMNAVQIELRKIYRQHDNEFINLLNNIRNREMSEDDYQLLKQRYKPTYMPRNEGYVILSSHNSKVNMVNDQELKNLPGFLYSFTAEVEGDFPESMYPCEAELFLKNGAQVMFIKNDTEGGNYYNGKLATVVSIDDEYIEVEFHDNKDRFIVGRDKWENINYKTDNREKITKNVIGEFRQYPLRLAWAITIHKSQGLTFDKVIIDAGQSFAAGQVYVALSRCTTLHGIVLHSMITPRVLFVDEKINTFSTTHHRLSQLYTLLEQGKASYAQTLLRKQFSFDRHVSQFEEWKEQIDARSIPNKEEAVKLYEQLWPHINSLKEVALKFQAQLHQLLQQMDATGNVEPIIERSRKATEYFIKTIHDQLYTPLQQHVAVYSKKTKVKSYLTFVSSTIASLGNTLHRLQTAMFMDEKLFDGEHIIHNNDIQEHIKSPTKKGETFAITLQMFNEGKTAAEIAKERSITLSTVYGHLARWVAAGDVQAENIVNKDDMEIISQYLENNKIESISEAYNYFHGKYDYGILRIVTNHLAHKKEMLNN